MQNVTNLTLHSNYSLTSKFQILLSIQWGSLENLIYLDLDDSFVDYGKNDAFVQISSLSKNLQFLRISGKQTITTGRDSWIETGHRTGLGP